ncbi:ABC transporter ATP-binding protein [Secundilactobacillus pentosiphilus]|uniref:ABC transporter ATP-binding protein n=1 Tax=Secundilactobacillus pentosiphilus TaxID=1714682 RepID=A0A1Z5ISU5_9LACO|nr:ATP-binding cassette domain-containing protein [Secundilactobacillus pentosiphilus]GAX04835.1 ABC transporter ATP-binding protein [Secundilactobacillus pentosiphilus]
MTKPILELRHVVTKVNRNTPEELTLLKDLNLSINEGDFITILGSNGAGKSTLFNTIAGNLTIDSGDILLRGQSIANESEERRTRFLSRVFQDPKLGTAPRMTVAENLLLATKRGEHRHLKPRHLKQHMAEFKQMTSGMGNDLDERLTTPTGSLSGGQRQALSFLMATLKKPDILLLDEHTAALDPKTSQELMAATNERITAQKLTCLMITHHLDDALKYGNRLIVISDGKITYDVSGEEKQQLTQEKLYSFFSDLQE